MFYYQIELVMQDIGLFFGGECVSGGQGVIGSVDGVVCFFCFYFGYIVEWFFVGGVVYGDDIVVVCVVLVVIDKGLLVEQGRVVKLYNCFLFEGLMGKCGVQCVYVVCCMQCMFGVVLVCVQCLNFIDDMCVDRYC